MKPDTDNGRVWFQRNRAAHWSFRTFSAPMLQTPQRGSRSYELQPRRLIGADPGNQHWPAGRDCVMRIRDPELAAHRGPLLVTVQRLDKE